jgi:hypothetical protein
VVSHQHEDMSDHRFERRGLLHAEVQVHGRSVHVIIRTSGSDPGQSHAPGHSATGLHCPPRFRPRRPRSWRAILTRLGQQCQQGPGAKPAAVPAGTASPTFPSRLPLVQLDYVYARGLVPLGVRVPHGRIWRNVGPPTADCRIRIAGLIAVVVMSALQTGHGCNCSRTRLLSRVDRGD